MATDRRRIASQQGRGKGGWQYPRQERGGAPRQNSPNSQRQKGNNGYETPGTHPVDVPGAEYAERALVALALDPMASLRHPAIREAQGVRLEKFRDFHHRAVAEVIQARTDRGEDSDIITVFEELKFRGLIGDGGACVFRDMTDFSAMYESGELVTALDPALYAKQIHRAYAQRITVERARDLYMSATRGPEEIAAALPIIATEINAANREAQPDNAYARFAPVDLREWKKRPRARMLDAEMKLREGQSLMIYGETNSGKTLYLLYRLALLACGVSTGTPEHVLYYCGEGQAGIMGRIEAILLYHHLDVETFYDHFHLVPDMPQLVTAPDELEAAIELAKELDVCFTVVALDTLTTAMEGLNDNASEYMTAVHGAIRRLARELGATPIIVHHPGKDVTRGPRGSGVVKNGLDITLVVSQAEQNGVITIHHDKMRDGEKLRWAYRIVRQLLAGDEWAEDPQPVLQGGATPAATPAPAQRAKLDATALKVWKILDDTGGTRWNTWLNLCESQGIIQATAKSAIWRLKEVSRVGKVEETGEWKALPEPESG